MLIPNYYKKIGFSLLILAAFSWILSLFYNFNALGIEIAVITFLTGLVIITLSKEVNETKEIAFLRFESFFFIFFGVFVGLVIITIINIALANKGITVNVIKDSINENNFVKFATISLACHLLYFNRKKKTSK